jgi:hypothetical protein
MPLQVPVSYHLDLYRYWVSKCGNCAMPARRDINPADICVLLPYLTIIDKVDGRLHYRLIGSVAAKHRGRDLTGRFVGCYDTPPEGAEKIRAAYESVFAAGRPAFVMGEYRSRWGNFHNMSQLVLPLSDDGANVNMIFYIRIARLKIDASSERGGVAFRVRDLVSVDSAEDARRLCLDWERRCMSDNAAAQEA